MTQQQYQPVSLFGGAISADYPVNFGDVSNIREVPDNQEVHLDNDGFSSIVVDILERVDLPDIEALGVHVEEIVAEDVPSMRLLTRDTTTVPNFPPNTPAYLCTAVVPTPENRRGRANEPDFVGILVLLIRLAGKGTDLVVAVNVPHVVGEYDPSGVNFEQGRLGELMERAGEWMERLRGNLEVREWGLFGE